MSNLLQETKEILELHGKTLSDVKWWGTNILKSTTDLQEVFNFEYDSGYGAQEVATDLIIVGDNFYLTRGEYDGSEWWDYHTPIEEPSESLAISKVHGGLWDDIRTYNKNV